mmetsp:Transcript_13006/g.28109  ORF Transcript_13006/g.28109 Transcript_13006/m.28109 type:complete len:262 (+) Transcript_13006:1138-1923(+)
MDLVVAHVEVEVPARRPLDGRVLPRDVVRKDNLERLALEKHRLRRQVRTHRHREQIQLGHVRRERALVPVQHRKRLHLKADEARALELRLRVELDDEMQVVVDVRLLGRRAWPVVGSQEAERVAAIVHGDGLAVGHLPDHLGGGRQVVHDEVDAVVLADALPQQRNLLGAQLLAAEHLEVTLAHANLVRRVLNYGAVQHLAQVLNRVRDLGRLAKRERVVVVRELRLCRRELVHLDLDLLAILELARCDARQVEGGGGGGE